MATLFFSYCHRDEDLRNEMEIHFSMLKRQGVISTWHDRRIGAGSEIDQTISHHLETADIIVLLVSPYFLDSDYCYDREMTRAMERHEAGEAIVVPIILHPCDWHPAPFGKLLATPTDGKAISMFANPHEAFAIVTSDIRNAASRVGNNTGSTTSQTAPVPPPVVSEPENTFHPRSSNLRVARSFSDHEKDEFLENTFEYISRFFDGSLAELEQRNSQIQSKFRKIDNDRFTASIYSEGQKKSQCTIWLGRNSHFGSGIFYSSSETSSENSYNESINVDDDGYTLYLKALGMSFVNRQKDELSQEGAAEYFWSMLIHSLQY